MLILYKGMFYDSMSTYALGILYYRVLFFEYPSAAGLPAFDTQNRNPNVLLHLKKAFNHPCASSSIAPKRKFKDLPALTAPAFSTFSLGDDSVPSQMTADRCRYQPTFHLSQPLFVCSFAQSQLSEIIDPICNVSIPAVKSAFPSLLLVACGAGQIVAWYTVVFK